MMMMTMMTMMIVIVIRKRKQASKTTELYLILFDQQTEGNADGNRRNWNGRKREKVSKAGAR